jgi:uncharacterized protein (TIGR03066 family)
MKAPRLLAGLAVVCVLAVGARAEEKKDYAKMLVGKWEVTKADEGTLPLGAVIEFTKDGKFKALSKDAGKDPLLEGTYKVDGEKFLLTFKMGDQSFDLTITITKLTDDVMNTKNDEGKVVETKRKK